MSKLKAELALDGKCASLGSLLFPTVKIRAFGPEVPPLGGKGFGIRSLSFHEGRWASPKGLPEVWFASKISASERKVFLDFSFFGLVKENPLFFSFYVESTQAAVEGKVIEVGSLHKFSGPAHSVVLGNEVELNGEGTSLLEVIPIAGASFWNCQYLIAFSLSPFHSKFSFSATLLAK